VTDRTGDAESGATPTFVAFSGSTCVGVGDLAEVARAARGALDRDAEAAVLVFDGQTAKVVDLDLRGAEHEVAARFASPVAAVPKRGRPKLGVTAREVTLLPRHWEWLARQPGGASVTLRRLVEIARKADDSAGRARSRAEAAYRFMAAMGGDLAGFEEAARALFAGDFKQLESHMSRWPSDIRKQALLFANPGD
jgi:hypothetical protein